jgi:hypothetical protein
MEKRMDWKETPTFNTIYQFKWHPISKYIKFELLNPVQKQMVNHLEYHYELTTKDCLFKNLAMHCEV